MTWWNIDYSVAIASVKIIFAAIFLYVALYFDMPPLMTTSIVDNLVSSY